MSKQNVCMSVPLFRLNISWKRFDNEVLLEFDLILQSFCVFNSLSCGNIAFSQSFLKL